MAMMSEHSLSMWNHGDDGENRAAPMLVDRREAGRLLGVSPGTIDNLRLRGELASVKVRARRLFDVADLRRFIEARKGG
jgi:excisionase family DNA binding protein